MMYRNMLAMETEELLRSHPVDGAVLMGGCDKTTPGLLLGATSMDLPAIFVPAGPMLRGNWQGKVLGSGSDSWKYWDELRAGTITDEDWLGVEGGIARSYGTCMTMGTASTMTAIAEALGMVLPGGVEHPGGRRRAHPPGVRERAAHRRHGLGGPQPEPHPDAPAFGNAIAVAMAMGCSTNAIIHLIAMARRAGHDVGLADFERSSRTVPVIANVRPSGTRYLMEDFFYAGGSRALMDVLREHLALDCLTVTGRTLGENIAGARVYDDDVIRPLDKPIYREGSLAVLTGNLAPDGCVIKPAAMDERFLKHSGPALVFDDYPSLKAAVDDEALDVTADHVLVLRNAGPQGGPGMPEWGMLPMPKKLLKQGHRDMLRLSDARMSGTSYGACVLHVSPESWVGGPLALLRTGDIVTLDVDARSIRMEVDDAELSRRRASWTPPPRTLRAGLRPHVQPAHPAGERGLRLRFPAHGLRRPGPGARHLLIGRCSPALDERHLARSRPWMAWTRIHACRVRRYKGEPLHCAGSQRLYVRKRTFGCSLGPLPARAGLQRRQTLAQSVAQDVRQRCGDRARGSLARMQRKNDLRQRWQPAFTRSERAHAIGKTDASVRTVTPRPAVTAAHNPVRLGLLKATRHETPARSRAEIPAARKPQGGSNATIGSGSPERTGSSLALGPIQQIGSSASCSACAPSGTFQVKARSSFAVLTRFSSSLPRSTKTSTRDARVLPREAR